jgi:parallel beta-helix repeat protein
VTLCTVASTGRGTAFGPDHDAIGIAAVGPGIQVGGNTVTGTYATGHGMGYGVAVSAADGADIGTNQVAAVRTRSTTGIFVDASSGMTVHDNALSNLRFGIVLANGSTGTTSNNTMTGVTTPYVGP